MTTNECIERAFWQRFDRAFGKPPQAYADLVDALRQQATAYFKTFQKCLIRGSEIEFERFVAPAELATVCQDIWEHPAKYSAYQDGSEAAYAEFLKYLWVEYPDGPEAVGRGGDAMTTPELTLKLRDMVDGATCHIEHPAHGVRRIFKDANGYTCDGRTADAETMAATVTGGQAVRYHGVTSVK